MIWNLGTTIILSITAPGSEATNYDYAAKSSIYEPNWIEETAIFRGCSLMTLQVLEESQKLEFLNYQYL